MSSPGTAHARHDRIVALRKRVAMRRGQLIDNDHGWLLPLAGFAAGLLAPKFARSEGKNPAATIVNAIKRLTGRMVRLTFLTSGLKLLNSREPFPVPDREG